MLLKELLLASGQQLQGRSFGDGMELGKDCSLKQVLADQQEIKNLQTHQTELKEALAETRFRLDSLHLVVVES